MSRFPVVIRRNDAKRDGFRRWTVYVGKVEAFDIEATVVDAKVSKHWLRRSKRRPRTALVRVIRAGGVRAALHFDGRDHEKPGVTARHRCGWCGEAGHSPSECAEASK